MPIPALARRAASRVGTRTRSTAKTKAATKVKSSRALTVRGKSVPLVKNATTVGAPYESGAHTQRENWRDDRGGVDDGWGTASHFRCSEQWVAR